MDTFKLTQQKQCTVLSWQGKLLVAVVIFLLALLFIKTIPHFLSVHQPVQGDILLLDGQMPDFAIEEAIKIFNEGNYKMIITTGGRIPSGFYVANLKTMAELTQATFLKLGFPADRIVALPTGNILRNRTYNSALTSKKWFIENETTFTRIDVLAIGSHARRSRLLFQKALGENFEVGIVCVNDPSYDSIHWWRSSVGSRIIISETIAYIYSKLFI